MKQVTLSVPPPFSTGPQFDEDGNLVPGSWPVGLPYEGITGWVVLGTPSGGRELVDFVVDDDWPIGDIPPGWLADGSMKWDMVTQDEYDENGNLVNPAIEVEVPTDYPEYNSHLVDENGDPRTDVSRAHVYLGWPPIDSQLVDLDKDGNPDTPILIPTPADVGSIGVSVDEDSINIDIDGDGDADIVIPIP